MFNTEEDKNTCKIRFLYANANGVASKTNCLKNILSSEEIDFALITETKCTGLAPSIPGYTWISRKAKPNKSGGLGIVVKDGLTSNVNTITNLHGNEEQIEVLWVKVNTPSDKPFALGVFYGKQENTKEEEIEAQFKALLTDIHLLMQDHRIILAGDFNAKLKVQKVAVKQEQSQNGRWLQELIELSHMQVITLNDETGQWTRENRANPNEKSVIDYVLTDACTKGEVEEIVVDQDGQYVLKGENGKMSDHNTIMFTLNVDLKQEDKVKIVWKKGDREKWNNVNKGIIEE